MGYQFPKWTAAIAVTLFQNVSAYADVNLVRGSYSATFIDVREKSFTINRKYDSRSTYSGLFGFGWCSPLEKTALNLPTGQIQFTNCDRVSKIDLGKNWTKLENGLRLQTEDKTTWTFDQSGKLIAIREKDQRDTRLLYDEGRLLRSAVTGEGKEIRFVRDPLSAGRVTALMNAATPISQYTYRGHTLLSATNAWKNRYSYRYDSTDNLTAILYPDGTHENLTYDSKRDLISSRTGRDGCIENYTFENRSPLLLTARAEKICDGWSKPKIAEVDFHFTANPDHTLHLIAKEH